MMTEADRHAIPDLLRVTDPDAMSAWLRECGIAADAVSLTWYRGEPGRAVVGFEIEHRDEDGKATRLPGFVKAYADDRASLIASKWKRLRPIPTALGAGVRLAPSGHAVVFLFPNDAGLRDLASLVLPDRFKRLSPGWEFFAGGPWRAKGRSRRLTTLRYKPEHRFVGRLTLSLVNDATGEKRRGDAVVRCIPPTRGHFLFNVATALEGAGLGATTPAPLALLAGGSIHLEEAVDGPSLDTRLDAEPDVADAVAAALVRLHDEATPPRVAARARGESEALVGLLHGRGRARADLGRAERRLRALETHAAAGGEGFVHGDLHPKQVLLAARGPVFVDFERAGRGSRLLDVGNLCADLLVTARHEPERAAGVLAFRDRFLAAYESRVSVDRRALSFFIARGLLLRGEVARRRSSVGLEDSVESIREAVLEEVLR